MARPITLLTAQYGDLSLEEVCRLAGSIGYEGLELPTQCHIDVHKVVEEPGYAQRLKGTLSEYNLSVWAISAHLAGQCVGDNWDQRLDTFAPSRLSGNPEGIRKWAVEEMKTTARAAQALGVKVITGFLGSTIWGYWYSFPPTTKEMVDEGFRRIKELWSPIFDVFDECGVKFALEVHPTEIAFDYYSTQRLLEEFEYRPTLGINFDPSHLVWQGVNPTTYLRDFQSRIYHVHMKDVKLSRDGRGGILGSHLDFGDTRRGWNFVSLGHGDVDFDGIIRELNQMGYDGPLSVEWEDSGMERNFGATEAFEFVKKINFSPSDVSFDASMKMK
ncbi:sugar phosphate isomerase/epimerase [Oscillospiraceae bacterium MB08-C2-2]|nr:sugar phosphate isomerase/epimerase [Oscillospiraceae bacterium MB08-C2-2]